MSRQGLRIKIALFVGVATILVVPFIGSFVNAQEGSVSATNGATSLGIASGTGSTSGSSGGGTGTQGSPDSSLKLGSRTKLAEDRRKTKLSGLSVATRQNQENKDTKQQSGRELDSLVSYISNLLNGAGGAGGASGGGYGLNSLSAGDSEGDVEVEPAPALINGLTVIISNLVEQIQKELADFFRGLGGDQEVARGLSQRLAQRLQQRGDGGSGVSQVKTERQSAQEVERKEMVTKLAQMLANTQAANKARGLDG